MEQPIKQKRQMTAEQLEVLKARLLKAREAKLAQVKITYNANKDIIKEEGLKKRTLTKIKALVSNGKVKEEEIMDILPKKEVPKQIPEEIPFEVELPKKRVPKTKPQPQPDIIPFETLLPTKRLPKPKQTEPIDIPQKKDKERYMKLIYYKEPSKAVVKKLNKLQDSSSDSDSDSDSYIQQPVNNKAVVVDDEDQYYKTLAKKYYGC